MKPPKGKVFHDEQEMRGSDYLDEFKKQKVKNPELIRKAAEEFRQSSNPEGKDISQFLTAWYWREKGVLEKDDKKACTYFLKSATAFNKDKRTTNEAKKIMLEFYKRKLDISHATNSDPTEFFMKRAKIYKELGQEKEYNVEMCIYYIFASTHNVRELNQAISLLEKSVKHAELSGVEEFASKARGMLHKLKSHASSTLEEAIKEIKEELEEIEKTSDKFGKETALGDLHFLNSQAETAPEKKISLLEQAAEYYDKAKMPERAHTIRGDIYQFKANKTKATDKDHADLFKLASEEYGKAGNIRMQKLLAGHYEVALATINGVFGDNSKEFKDRLVAANHLYKDAGNVGGVQFTAGIGVFMEASRAKYPDSVKLFQVAAECLESVKEYYLAAFAKSEMLSQKASRAVSKEEQDALMLEEKNYLEKAIIENKKRSSSQSIQFPVDGVMVQPKIFDGLNKARLHELNGFIETDGDIRKKYFLRAKQEYLSLESSGAFASTVLSGIGWASLFLEDASDAKKYFEKLQKIKPDNPHVKLGLEAVDGLIKVKYSKGATDALIRKRVSQPLMMELGEDISLVKNGEPYPSEFFNLCLAMVKDSCSQIERFRKNFFNSDEPTIRNQILMLSNSVAGKGLGINLTGETFTGEGKSDIAAVNPENHNDYFLSECKIWQSAGEYKKGVNQLVGRYKTQTDKAAVLINFVKEGKFSEVMEKSIQSVKDLDPEAAINVVDEKNFLSTHKEHGIIFHHLVDLIDSSGRRGNGKTL